MIETRNVTKTFGPHRVLDDVSLRIPAGSVTAVLGPNASGKSTLIKCILGLVHPDRGTILVGGEPVLGRWRYCARVGYMPQIARFPDNLTVEELFGMLRELRRHEGDLDIELFARYHLGDIGRQRVATLSGGTRQKINAAIAFLFSPGFLVLDEPTVGLDPVSTTVFKDKVRKERSAGKTVLLTSHLVNEIEELADHVVYILEGKPFFTGTVADLKQKTSETRLDRALVRVMEERDGTSRR